MNKTFVMSQWAVSKLFNSSYNSIINLIMLNTYSESDVVKNNFGEVINDLYIKSPLIKDVLIGSSYFIKEIPIFLLIKTIREDFDNTSEAGGYYTFDKHIVIGECGNLNLWCQGALIHELSHMLMHKLFNNWAHPYYFDELSSQKIKYEQAFFSSLRNIASYFMLSRKEYDYLKDSKTLGQKLYEIVPMYDGFLNTILSTFDPNVYNIAEYDREFIVRFPELIALNVANDELHLLAPLQYYWEIEISQLIISLTNNSD